MRCVLLLLLGGFLVNALKGQVNTEVIVVGLLKTDRTFNRGEKRMLETRVARDQIIYTYDSSSKSFVVKEYVSESGYNIRDGERTIKEKHKVRTPHFSNGIAQDQLQRFLSLFGTRVDSLPKYAAFVHTPHYYLSVYVNVVVNGDTTTWRKSQPFESSTPWQGPDRVTLDPAIDAFIVGMLPKKFVGRDALAKPRAPQTDPTSTARPALRVKDISGKPASPAHSLTNQ